MSASTTNTNEPSGLQAGSSEQASKLTGEGLAVAMAALPDLATITRLANEFFTALPGNPGEPALASVAAPSASVDPAESLEMPAAFAKLASEVPVAAQPPDVPGASSFYFVDAEKTASRDAAFTFPASVDLFGLPAGPAYPGASAGVPGVPVGLTAPFAGSVPSQSTAPGAQASGIPGWSAYFLDVENAAPWKGTVEFPPGLEMFSYPGVLSGAPGVDAASLGSPGSFGSAPGKLRPGGPQSEPAIDLASAPWSSVAEYPGGAKAISFPDVPELDGSPFIPLIDHRGTQGSTGEPSASPATAEADLGKLSHSLGLTNPVAGHVPAPALPEGTPGPTAYVVDAEKSVLAAGEPKAPSLSKVGVQGMPGTQVAPGTPVVPASAPGEVRIPGIGESFSQPWISESAAEKWSAYFLEPSAQGIKPEFMDGSDRSAEALRQPNGEPKAALFGKELDWRRFAGEGARATQPGIADKSAGAALFDPYAIKRDFPILQERVHGKQLVWLDNAATTQKPQAVIDRLAEFYRRENSNVHRAAHTLAARSTDAYESAREKVRRFMNAPSTREIVFVRGTTEAINLAARSWGQKFIGKDDEVVISWLEHHSNIVPWQMLCSEKGARLRPAPVDNDGQILLDEYERLLSSKTKLVAITQVSNALGTILPVREMIQMAHRHGAKVLVDGAQSVAHMRVDVQALDCDFFVFSGHKIFAPTGIGVLYGKPEVLAEAPPWQGGGSMIVDVTFEKSVYQAPPARFEAGTGNIADAVGLGAALDYLEEIGMENIARHEHELLEYGMKQLRTVPGLRLIGTAREKASVMSFVLEGHKTEEIGAALDREGIAVRAGHHCAQPSLRRFGLETSVRPSLALYNTREDVDALVSAVRQIQGAGR